VIISVKKIIMKKIKDYQYVSAHSNLERAGVRIKICGMKYPENILGVSTLVPDFMGFIFWEKKILFP
jgi:phosphoribosylanthranilate isomerase